MVDVHKKYHEFDAVGEAVWLQMIASVTHSVTIPNYTQGLTCCEVVVVFVGACKLISSFHRQLGFRQVLLYCSFAKDKWQSNDYLKAEYDQQASKKYQRSMIEMNGPKKCRNYKQQACLDGQTKCEEK